MAKKHTKPVEVAAAVAAETPTDWLDEAASIDPLPLDPEADRSADDRPAATLPAESWTEPADRSESDPTAVEAMNFPADVTAGDGLAVRDEPPAVIESPLVGDVTADIDQPGSDPGIVLARDPGSCVNCGQVGFPIKVLRPGVYQCSRCKHEWTSQEESAPFRRGLNLK